MFPRMHGVGDAHRHGSLICSQCLLWVSQNSKSNESFFLKKYRDFTKFLGEIALEETLAKYLWSTNIGRKTHLLYHKLQVICRQEFFLPHSVGLFPTLLTRSSYLNLTFNWHNKACQLSHLPVAVLCENLFLYSETPSFMRLEAKFHFWFTLWVCKDLLIFWNPDLCGFITVHQLSLVTNHWMMVMITTSGNPAYVQKMLFCLLIYLFIFFLKFTSSLPWLMFT